MTNQRTIATTSAALFIVSVLLGSCNMPSSTIPADSAETRVEDPVPTAGPATSVPPSPTPEPSLTFEPEFTRPTGYQDYTDRLSGIIISLPESWAVTGIQEGQFAILQSYPEGKYIGGEPREEGDTKCDLNLNPDLTGPDDLETAWENSNITTLLAESMIPLPGGQSAHRYEIDSMGRANLILADLEGRLVTLTCFGELSEFDSIAGTLRLSITQ